MGHGLTWLVTCMALTWFVTWFAVCLQEEERVDAGAISDIMAAMAGVEKAGGVGSRDSSSRDSSRDSSSRDSSRDSS